MTGPRSWRCGLGFVAGVAALLFPSTPALASASGGIVPGGITAGVSFGTPPEPGSSSSDPCRFELARPDDIEFGRSEPTSRWIGDRLYWLYDHICDDIMATLWIPESTPAQLGQDATAQISRLLPAPRVGTAPTPSRLVVHSPVWFWTDPTLWHPVQVTAWVPTPTGILWSTARARPMRLRLDAPRLADPRRASCPGPGPIWRIEDGDTTGSPCQIVFTTTLDRVGSRAWDLVMHIDWQVDWWSSTGDSGAAGTVTTSTATPARAHEILALVSG